MKEQRSFPKKKKKPTTTERVVVEKPCEIRPPQPSVQVFGSNYYTIQQFEEAVSDEITVDAYHDAILNNSNLFADKIVLHLTHGINFLYSVFACKAGAAKVYCAVEGSRQQQNVQMIRALVQQNNLAIEVVQYKQFNAEVDIIISQPLGYCMHFDSLIDRMIQARDLFLDKHGGLMFPSVLSLKCALIHDEYYQDDKQEYWNNVYGVQMKSVKKEVMRDPIVRMVDPALVVSTVAKLQTLDLRKINYCEVVEIKKEVYLQSVGLSKANGLVVWGELTFKEGVPVQIKASPWCESIKYTQVIIIIYEVCFYGQMRQYSQGEKIKITVEGKRFTNQGYTQLEVGINENKQQYCFS